jgi:hypothetical protein
VPPPPAAGGPGGTGLWLAVGVGLVLAVGGVLKTEEDGLGLRVGSVLRLGLGLRLWPGRVFELAGTEALPELALPELALPELVVAGALALPGAEPDTEGMVGVDVEFEVHADAAAQASTVSRPTPASRALSVSRAMVIRCLIKPPERAIYGGSFPGSGNTNPHRKN